jgi:hypothetical protein
MGKAGNGGQMQIEPICLVPDHFILRKIFSDALKYHILQNNNKHRNEFTSLHHNNFLLICIVHEPPSKSLY